MPAKKTTSTEMVRWDEELASAAQAASSKHQQAIGVSNWIGTRAGILTFKQTKIKNNTIDAVVVADTFENAYYTGSFNPDEPKPPVCFAFGDDVATMVPHEASPKKQSETCAACQWNKFGTAKSQDGTPMKGKACKNIVRMALVQIADIRKVGDKAEVAFLKTTVTSRGPFAKYAKDVEDNMHAPLWGVVTRISLEPNEDTQFKMNFELQEELKSASDALKLFPVVKKFSVSQMEALLIPYQAIADQPEAAAPARKSNKFAKPAAKKTASKR